MTERTITPLLDLLPDPIQHLLVPPVLVNHQRVMAGIGRPVVRDIYAVLSHGRNQRAHLPNQPLAIACNHNRLGEVGEEPGELAGLAVRVVAVVVT